MKTLFVFSSSRALNRFLQHNQSAFLPQCMLLGEFFSQSIFIQGKQKIPRFLKKIFLIETLKEFELNTTQLQALMFEKNFLAFLESSSFLFGFFDELFQHQVCIEEITQYDVYGDYQDHLQVLQKIYEAYEKKLSLYGFYDFPKEYEIFESFLKHFGGVEIFLDGFLSHFEKKLLQRIAEFVPVKLHLELDKYNLSHFAFLNPKLQADYAYVLSFPSGEILEQTPQNQIAQVSLTPYKLRISQSALIFEKIQEWLDCGISADRIAVIVPNEGFIQYLQVLDTYRTLNYAMGLDCQKQKFYLKLEAIKNQTLHHKEGLGSEKIARLREDVKANMDFISSDFSSYVDEVLFGYEKIADHFEGYAYGEIMHLFLQDLLGGMLSDNSGGKVRVIGVLESRGMEFDCVVLVDFVQEYLPSVSNHDFFLNSFVRKMLEMPTMQDKKDLQKHYYLQLFKHTKHIAVAYVEGECSTFLKENKISVNQSADRTTLFPQPKPFVYLPEECKGKITQKISASAMDLFVYCQRAFFYYYLKGYRPLSEDFSQNLGSLLHQILKQSYTLGVPKLQEVQKRFYASLQEQIHWESDPLMAVTLELEKRYFQHYFETEKLRETFEVLELEEGFEFQYFKNTLIGRIDRIDRVGEEIWVIDYKSGKNDKGSKFQSAIYALYAEQKYQAQQVRVFYYQLKEGKLQEEEKLQDCITQLQEVLEQMNGEIEFTQAQTRSKCQDCQYKLLCNR